MIRPMYSSPLSSLRFVDQIAEILHLPKIDKSLISFPNGTSDNDDDEVEDENERGPSVPSLSEQQSNVRQEATPPSSLG